MTEFSPFILNYSLPILSASLVGLCGIFPLLIIPTEVTEHLQSAAGSRKLNRLLSFAIGSMLGDVFLHLLPEAYQSFNSNPALSLLGSNSVGIWVLIGILCFLVIEKLFVQSDDDNVEAEGYLNLLANFIDNLTHGLAVGGSYTAGVKVGLITTFCILVHEIPHEISDFAILLRAGFHRWRAAKAQLITASGSVLGAAAAYSSSSSSSDSSWQFGCISIDSVLAFTSGGFLYLALASLAPQILKEIDSKESLVQVLCLLCGFLSLYVVSLYL